MKIEAEQTRAGMVFDHLPTGKRVTTIRLYSERPQTIACRLHAWECNPGGVLVEAGPDFAFLGCDPALAARADCEQYGIAPGCDAAAHGFARTREGKAHDMRRSMPVGSIYTYDDEPAKERRIVRTGPAFLPSGCSFVGLRADVADWRDGAYLCCGTAHAPPGETFKHITETGKRDVVCTLAIGDHAEHEDIAAGVKWPATMTGTWSSGMAGAPVTHVGALVNDGVRGGAMSAQDPALRSSTYDDECVINLHVPHVATLSDGATVALPAGTALRVVVAGEGR